MCWWTDDIDRSRYDFRFDEDDAVKVDEGLTEEIVLEISKEKKDPEWMRDFRLEALKKYHEIPFPEWGPDIDGLNMDHIVTYIRPNMQRMQTKWEDVPENIKETFTRLGIPQAEGSEPSMIPSWSIIM